MAKAKRGIDVLFNDPTFKEGCPKCSCHLIGGGIEEHIKNCTSTLVQDGAKTISDMVDKMIIDSIRKSV